MATVPIMATPRKEAPPRPRSPALDSPPVVGCDWKRFSRSALPPTSHDRFRWFGDRNPGYTRSLQRAFPDEFGEVSERARTMGRFACGVETADAYGALGFHGCGGRPLVAL